MRVRSRRRYDKAGHRFLIVMMGSRGPVHTVVRRKRVTIALLKRVKRLAGVSQDAPVQVRSLADQ